MKILDKLFSFQDKEYAMFQAKLTPGISQEKFIGVRVPDVRKIAKEYIKDDESKSFLNVLPHQYYDENMLHGLLISEINDFDECIERLEKFLPFVDNWAVCDIMSPKCFKKNKDKVMPYILKWIKQDHTYTIRFAIEMIMSLFLDKDYKKEYLDVVSKVRSNEYYVNMMIAWFFATALSKQYDDAIKYIENNKLDTWVHNKTIQKARESFRITKEQKEYLLSLKLKN